MNKANFDNSYDYEKYFIEEYKSVIKCMIDHGAIVNKEDKK